MPKIKITLYRPVLPEATKTFENILQGVSRLPIRRRIEPAGSNRRAIIEVRRDDRQHVGVASLIRMDGLPNRTNTRTGERVPLDLDDPEGLGEEIYFAYDAGLHVIAVQNSRQLRAPGLRNWLVELTGENIEFHMILRGDAWQQFNRARLIKKFNIKIARPQDLGQQPLPSLRRLLTEMEEFDGILAETTISVGRERGRGLAREIVERVIRGALNMAPNIEALNVTARVGSEGEEETEEIDFLEWQLVSYANVELDREGRGYNSLQCRRAVTGAIREHRDYLRRYRL